MWNDCISYLLGFAMAHTGLPVPAELPEIKQMDRESMMVEICADEEDPKACEGQQGLQAAYLPKTNTIVIPNTFQQENEIDASFVLHELVHAMQYGSKGDDIFKDCKALYQTEWEAYRVQQEYLNSHSQMLRVGYAMRFINC